MRGSRTVFEAWRASRTAGRRARNLRRGARRNDTSKPVPAALPRFSLPALRAPRPVEWVALASVAGALLGAVVIAGHARQLSVAAGAVGAVDGVYAVDAFQAVLPGAAFTVASTPGIDLEQRDGAALLMASSMRGAAPARIDLCSQMADRTSGRLLPLRLGYQFSDVAAWVARNASGATNVTPRNVVLAAPDAPMPRIEITGTASAMQLRWAGVAGVRDVRWIGDASGGKIVHAQAGANPLGRDGWLLWHAGEQMAALRIVRRASGACPAAGELQVQLLRPGAEAAGRTQVMAYGAGTQTAWLPAGRYQVPMHAAPALEDQALFKQLQARGLLRLADGLVDLAPRDLAAWRAAQDGSRAAALATWDGVALDPAALALIDRLYHRADGDFVRAQVDIFNGERRLLAWRARPGAVAGTWDASVDGAPAAIALAMPAAAARLFAQLPQGWDAWRRIGAWPAGRVAQLRYTLARPAVGNEVVTLMVLGRVGTVSGARMAGIDAACTGRACATPDAAQEVRLALLPGATHVALSATPMNAGALAAPGDDAYRHIRLTGGTLAWQAVATGTVQPGAALAPVTLVDRNGAALWSDGAPVAAASAAGLAPLLGYRADQANSVAGMLGRVDGGAHTARLSLDLALQAASQQALDCIGMRRGQWDGAHCAGGAAPPPGRHAGMVLLDAETGDVLAAAGAGAGPVDAANWSEVRDFDRLDPARSPLRLPALQHDGGIHRSPGSTFKIISALGLELAAQRDPQLDAVIGGMPLAGLDALARQRGFAFQTDAPAYPWDPATNQAHVTNYREQQAGRRAQDGRLGLAQALTYSLNTWFAWAGELSDRSLFGRGAGGAPDLAGLEPAALDSVRPIVAMAHRLGFEQALRLDGGLLPASFNWSPWDALQTTASHIDPIHARHELRQMAIGLRMQTTPLQMALAAGAVGQGRIAAPRLLLAFDGRAARDVEAPATGVRLDRIRAGMKGVVDVGTAANAFKAPELATVRRGLFGKTGTAPTSGTDGATATVWFTGYLEPGSIPGQRHRLAFATFVSHSEAGGGDHAAPVVAAVLKGMAAGAGQKPEEKGKQVPDARLAQRSSMAR